MWSNTIIFIATYNSIYSYYYGYLLKTLITWNIEWLMWNNTQITALLIALYDSQIQYFQCWNQWYMNVVFPLGWWSLGLWFVWVYLHNMLCSCYILRTHVAKQRWHIKGKYLLIFFSHWQFIVVLIYPKYQPSNITRLENRAITPGHMNRVNTEQI